MEEDERPKKKKEKIAGSVDLSPETEPALLKKAKAVQKEAPLAPASAQSSPKKVAADPSSNVEAAASRRQSTIPKAVDATVIDVPTLKGSEKHRAEASWEVSFSYIHSTAAQLVGTLATIAPRPHRNSRDRGGTRRCLQVVRQMVRRCLTCVSAE